MCKHLVAACILDKVALEGIPIVPVMIATLRRRGRRANKDASLSEEPELEQAKRGRPRKEISTALQVENPLAKKKGLKKK